MLGRTGSEGVRGMFREQSWKCCLRPSLVNRCKPNFRGSGVYVPRSVDWHPASRCIISLILRNTDGNQVAPLTREHPRRRYTPVDYPCTGVLRDATGVVNAALNADRLNRCGHLWLGFCRNKPFIVFGEISGLYMYVDQEIIIKLLVVRQEDRTEVKGARLGPERGAGTSLKCPTRTWLSPVSKSGLGTCASLADSGFLRGACVSARLCAPRAYQTRCRRMPAIEKNPVRDPKETNVGDQSRAVCAGRDCPCGNGLRSITRPPP